MALTLGDVRQISRAYYGLEYSSSEDPLFTNSFMNVLINRAYFWFAGVTLCCYNEDLTVTVSNGTSEYALDATVIKPDLRTFVFQSGSTPAYARLKCRTYHSLLEEKGPLQSVSAGTPTDFYVHAGSASGSAKQVVLVPGPTALTGDLILHYGAWVYPAELTADGTNLVLDEPDVYRLIPAVCWKMAEFEASRGRQDAPVQMWLNQALQEAQQFHRIVFESTRSIDRTPLVGMSPAQDALERRRANLGIGSTG